MSRNRLDLVSDDARDAVLERAAGEPRQAPATPPADETDALDAYSRAVVSVVEAITPAVVSVLRNGGSSGELGGAGSGVVITPDGYVLTNSHVVHGPRKLEARFADGHVSAASIIGEDPSTDLALLRLLDVDLPYVRFGDSRALKPGQLVIAVGNPLGFLSSDSTGVVSALGRAFRARDGRLIENIVQHTAPLNPGSSGGPLVDWQGRLVGINTAIIALAQGLSFAIPSDTAKWVAPQLLREGRVRRGLLGFAGRTASVPRLDRAPGRGRQGTGVEVMELVAGAPAEKAGVQVHDVIVQIGDEDISTIDDLHRFLTRSPIGEAVELAVVRRGETIVLHATPVDSV